ncbi:MAG: ferritin [Chloroflexi bacterium]|nr:ferritin [Anaerolineaceae bacterium]NMB87619.1 ferritin [Chloroflexota bacterium]
MLINQELNDAINAQIGREFGASLQYVNIAAYFSSEALLKLADFFFKQAEEERDHAMKFVHYILDAGGEVHIPPIEAPQSRFTNAEEAIQLSLNWEMDVTQYINNLMDIAVKNKDYIAQQFLNWFTNEQLEEVSSMNTLLQIVQRSGDRNLIMIEGYLSHLREDD